MFRGKFLAAMAALHSKLQFHGQIAPLQRKESFQHLSRRLKSKPWVVYSKRPFAGPQQVLHYLSLYTHRVAISPRRLLALDQQKQTVTFSYKDYADNARRKRMTLLLPEFLRRFLLHILPCGFTKIRHYGLLATNGRTQRLEQVRCLLGQRPQLRKIPVVGALQNFYRPRCPYCSSENLIVEQITFPEPIGKGPQLCDSS
jgi:hypothetical protein